jgi:Fic family protein
MLLAYHNSEIPRTLRAIVAMTGILNTHPFPDGNGRCARALFNAVLGQESGACFSSYVPLKAAMQASDAGFEIRLRDAETNGNWAPLIVYFTTVFRVLAEAHRTAACNERHKIARSDFR